MSQVQCYQDARGQVPIQDWLDDIRLHDQSTYHKFGEIVQQMEEGTLPLVRPNVKRTPPKRTGCSCLYKLRLGKYRLFFLLEDHEYRLLHAFRKSSNATPDKEFRIAKKEISHHQFVPLVL